MITTQMLIEYIEQLAGHPLNADEGMQRGQALREIHGVLVCWMATKEALARAVEQGCELVLAHESLYYPYNALQRSSNPPGWQDWPVNRQRREYLERYDLALLRAHGSLDEICIFDDFAAQLGLGAPLEVKGLAKTYEIAPCSLVALVAHVKERVGMGAVRVSAPRGMEQTVRHVGLPWGGLGLFVNVEYQAKLLQMGCDVLIAGESDNYGFRFSAESGIPMIETGHEISENPGLRHWAEMLQARFPELHVCFYECSPIWQMA